MKGVKSMKKQYVKPELYFENFELSTSIAACESNAGTYADGECGIDMPGFTETLFYEKITGCQKKVEDSEDICYHNPSGGLFNS